MPKTRIAIAGLGMAVAPHAKSAIDLKDRVDVACAFSPSASRRAQFAERFPFPQCDRFETILEDRSIECEVHALELDDSPVERTRVFRPRTRLAAVVLRELALDGRADALFLFAADDVVGATVSSVGGFGRIGGRGRCRGFLRTLLFLGRR